MNFSRFCAVILLVVSAFSPTMAVANGLHPKSNENKITTAKTHTVNMPRYHITFSYTLAPDRRQMHVHQVSRKRPGWDTLSVVLPVEVETWGEMRCYRATMPGKDYEGGAVFRLCHWGQDGKPYLVLHPSKAMVQAGHTAGGKKRYVSAPRIGRIKSSIKEALTS